jgi:hypothetical protein
VIGKRHLSSAITNDLASVPPSLPPSFPHLNSAYGFPQTIYQTSQYDIPPLLAALYCSFWPSPTPFPFSRAKTGGRGVRMRGRRRGKRRRRRRRQELGR